MSPRRPATSNRKRDDRGSASLELLILLPALFAILFLGMQAALFHHARTVAIAAAQEGARTAGAERGTDQGGVGAANAFISEAGGDDVLRSTHVSANRKAANVTITVTGYSLSVLPGWHPKVEQSATMPIERVTAP